MPQFDRPQPTVFERVEDERLHRKQRLAAAFRLFARFGFSEGVAGHITARDPEFTDHFWVNPFGVYFGHIRVCDLILVDREGEVVKGNRPVNRSAFTIHSQIQEARPDITAAAHVNLKELGSPVPSGRGGKAKRATVGLSAGSEFPHRLPRL